MKYTLVRHRDARSEPHMEFGVEVIAVRSPELVRKIEDAGGYVFADEESADEVAQSEVVPPDVTDDGWPHAPGWYDWQVTVKGEPIYKHGFTSKVVQKAAKKAAREAGPSVWNVIRAMHEELGGGTERACRLALQEIGFTIANDRVSK